MELLANAPMQTDLGLLNFVKDCGQISHPGAQTTCMGQVKWNPHFLCDCPFQVSGCEFCGQIPYGKDGK